MAVTNYSAKLADSDSVDVSYDFGDDLDSALELFGAEVVFSRYKAASVVDLQSFVRGQISKQMKAEDFDGTLDVDTIQDAVNEWTPGAGRRRGKSKEEKVKELLADMTEADKEALLASLADG